MSGDEQGHAGEARQVHDALCRRPPVQGPHIPIPAPDYTMRVNFAHAPLPDQNTRRAAPEAAGPVVIDESHNWTARGGVMTPDELATIKDDPHAWFPAETTLRLVAEIERHRGGGHFFTGRPEDDGDE